MWRVALFAGWGSWAVPPVARAAVKAAGPTGTFLGVRPCLQSEETRPEGGTRGYFRGGVGESQAFFCLKMQA